VAFTLVLGGVGLVRAEELPPVPKAWFNDYAGIVDTAEARRLDEELRQLDQETSTQIVVAVFPRLPSPSLEDFTSRTAEAWRVGRKGLDNGAIFFVFVEDKKMRIEVGYGLEGALPDALAGRILNDRVVPRFRQGDWAGGLEAGVDGIVAAVQGEYTSPSAAGASRGDRGVPLIVYIFIAVFVLALVLPILFGGRWQTGRTYGPGGWRRNRRRWGRGTQWGGGGGWGTGGGWGGGGGGFSAGGGSFGGGGASASW
jgi:uncharacterized protein